MPDRSIRSVLEIQELILERAPFLSVIGLATGTLQCRYCLTQWCICVNSDHTEFRLQGYSPHSSKCPVREKYPAMPGIDVTDISDMGIVINAEPCRRPGLYWIEGDR
mgnify:CR=1 FL=1